MTKLLIFILFTSSLCFAQKESKKVTTDWKTLNTATYSIQYPASWELSQNGQMGTSFIAFAPLQSTDDPFRENVNLLVQDLTGYNLDLEKYTELTLGQIKTMITNSSLIESKTIKSGTGEYHHLIYTGEQGIFQLKFEQYFWVKHNQAFVLTFTAEQSQYANYQEAGEKILNSFIFKE